MAQKYKFIRVRPEVIPNLKARTDSINRDLVAMGIKRGRVKMIDFIHILSSKPVFLSAEDLIKFAKKKSIQI